MLFELNWTVSGSVSDLYGKDVLISFSQGREDDRDEAGGGAGVGKEYKFWS